jgi:hypothetical protein
LKKQGAQRRREKRGREETDLDEFRSKIDTRDRGLRLCNEVEQQNNPKEESEFVHIGICKDELEIRRKVECSGRKAIQTNLQTIQR